MKAMILAAGLGTRLKPLTDEKPKALIPVLNKPIVARVIDYLKMHGVSRIVVNAHHHQQQIVDYMDGGRPFGLEIEVLVEPEILGTGGGIKNASALLDNETFIVINCDILTNINLVQAYRDHKKSGPLATLALHDYEPFNRIQIGKSHAITDIARKKIPGRLAFTGIHIMEPELLSHIPEVKYSDIIDCYRQLIPFGKSINAFLSEGHYWRDIGSVSSYIRANKELLKKESFSIGPGCHMDSSAKLEEWAIVGEKTYLEKDVEIRRSILWDNVKVKDGRSIVDSIVTSFREVDRDLVGEIY
jgi:NDP-sugar pyrophosphorylase family protein